LRPRPTGNVHLTASSCNAPAQFSAQAVFQRRRSALWGPSPPTPTRKLPSACPPNKQSGSATPAFRSCAFSDLFWRRGKSTGGGFRGMKRRGLKGKPLSVAAVYDRRLQAGGAAFFGKPAALSALGPKSRTVTQQVCPTFCALDSQVKWKSNAPGGSHDESAL
jgi:hypothetical protein